MIDRESTQRSSDTVRIERSLFKRSKTSNSSANISFFCNGTAYISRSGNCFGILKTDKFAVMGMNNASLSGGKPSKEWPLHLKAYQKEPGTGAVIHTHSTYGALWNFVPAKGETGVIPDHTPCLKMKLGKVRLVPYEKPGSQALLGALEQCVMGSDGYLLKQHGAVVPGESLVNAFFCLEELEESARTARILRQTGMRQGRVLTIPGLFP